MGMIRIGNHDIPIIHEIELTGDPASNLTGPSGLNSYFVPLTDFTLGVETGNGSAPRSPGTPTIYSNFLGGSTVLISDDVPHVPAEIYATDRIPSYVQAHVVEFYTQISVKKGTAALFTPGNMRLAHSWAGTTSSYSMESTVKWVALSYCYPNASNDDWKRKGYAVAAIEQQIQRTDTGEDITYGLANMFVIAIPNINRNQGIKLRYEELPDPPEEPDFDPSEPEPYDPSKDDSSDPINIPADPPIGVTGAGFINVYKPGLGSLQGLGEILFPNPASATDIVDAVIKLCETLANQNLINYVIDCHVIPCTPVTGSNANIKVGYRNTGISVPTVTSDYVSVSCGALSIQEYFGGFADYTGTVSKIYLPFIGFVDTKPEFWQAGTIAIDYKFNVIDGSFMCYIRSTSSKSQLSNTVIAQYAGNACMHFPLTGVNYSQMVSGVIGSVVAMASKGKILTDQALSAANTIAQGGDVQQSNGYNSTAAILGVRVPYLMIERVKPSYPSNYGHEKGLPSNITTTLSNVHGFTIISDIDLSGIPGNSNELEELRVLLNEGVYF